jgi:hypothetical protein
MATTTPNYSWPVPTSTDLVKDGATAIEALGDAIDATVFDSTGLVKINTTTFSAVSSQSINDVFSSTYDNYVILYKNTSSSANPLLTLRFRAAGTDTTTNYGSQRLYAIGTTVTASRDQVGSDEIFISDINSTTPNFVGHQINVFNPNQASATSTFSSGSTYLSTNLYVMTTAGFQNSSTQFTGFTLLVSTGTFGGTVSVYGVKQ